ncbi:uncharacterized protein LOC141601665 isoform X2 [Silene latifolia]|uniref:uncharacterized protein LOC141601665 isoform X2 n=1 Tax=Silene latifolia TaxID=37657 RepID=UPI003D782E67
MIYDAFGEPVDPYGQVKCSVCKGSKDECLLLLCDLCDSASHTYCVGLGATVPEDDWYCHDCDLLRAEQSDNEMGDNVENSPVPKEVKLENADVDESATSAPVSIFDIVREAEEPRRANPGTERLLKLASSNKTKFSSSAIVSDRASSSSSSKLRQPNMIPLSNNRESNARTLRKCRDVNKNLSVLRDNWDAFRAGSLSFSAQLSCPSGKVGQKKEAKMTPKRSCQSQSTMFSQSKTRETSGDPTPKEQSYNVQRAWKLMSAAKSLQLANKAKKDSSAPKNKQGLKVDEGVSKYVLSAKKDLMCANGTTPNLAKKVNGSLSQILCKHSTSDVPRSYVAPEAQKKVQTNIFSNKSSLASSGPSSHGAVVGNCDVSSTNTQRQRISATPEKKAGKFSFCGKSKDEAQNCVTDSRYERASLASGANLSPSLPKFSSDRQISVCPAFLPETVARDCDLSSNKLKEKEVSECPRSSGDKMTKKASKDGEAKGEILSLVKLNMKLLCKEKRLESETFKEIARLSTHTILASCGLAHRDIVRSIPTLVCHHVNQVQHLPRSALLPHSCRDCFYTFVKDVVNSILSEKTITDAVAC